MRTYEIVVLCGLFIIGITIIAIEYFLIAILEYKESLQNETMELGICKSCKNYKATIINPVQSAGKKMKRE